MERCDFEVWHEEVLSRRAKGVNGGLEKRFLAGVQGELSRLGRAGEGNTEAGSAGERHPPPGWTSPSSSPGAGRDLRTDELWVSCPTVLMRTCEG